MLTRQIRASGTEPCRVKHRIRALHGKPRRAALICRKCTSSAEARARRGPEANRSPRGPAAAPAGSGGAARRQLARLRRGDPGHQVVDLGVAPEREPPPACVDALADPVGPRQRVRVGRPRRRRLRVDDASPRAPPTPRRRRRRPGDRRAPGPAGPRATGPPALACSSAEIAPWRSISRSRSRPSRSQADASSGARRSLGRGLGGPGDRAHVLVDPRREPLGRRPVGFDPGPVADGRAPPPGGCPACQNAVVSSRSTAGFDGSASRAYTSRWAASAASPSASACCAAVMNRCTRSADGSGVEKSTNCSEPAGTVRTPIENEHAGPLLGVLVVAGEVDPGHGADAPLGIGDAARVAVHDRVVGHARAERVVLGAVLGGGPRALLLLVGAAARLLAGLPRGGRGHLDRVAGNPPASDRLGQLLELVGGLVDRLKVSLVLVLAPRRGDVGCQRLAIRRRASWTSRWSNGASSSRRSIACSTSRIRGMTLLR